MIFYTPMAPPNFEGTAFNPIKIRGNRYEEIAVHCWRETLAAGVIDLSRVASCIYTTYPTDLDGVTSDLSRLRGVAVFLGLSYRIGGASA